MPPIFFKTCQAASAFQKPEPGRKSFNHGLGSLGDQWRPDPIGLEQEFEEARRELEPLLQEKDRVSIVPGNHDRYVPDPEGKDSFDQYFQEFFGKTRFTIGICLADGN